MEILNLIAFWIGILGIIIITWGILLVILEFLYLEYNSLRKKTKVKRDKHDLRRHLGSYILLGLEFMIAGDIIHTVLKPNINSLIILGAIVVIRTVISYFLHLELKGKI